MIDQITRSVYEKWEMICPETRRPRKLRYILQSRRRILLFLFDEDRRGNQLVGVVKVSRLTAHNEVLIRSVELLGRIRKILTKPMLETVPKAVLLDPIDGLSASFEQAMVGVPMGINHYPWLAGRRHTANWDAWRSWLKGFQRQTLDSREELDSQQIDRFVLAPLNIAYEAGVISHNIQRDLNAVVRELERIKIGPVWRYGDTHHSNILTNRGKITGVVDWEGAQENQWPTLDWFQFAFQYLVDVLRLKSPTATQNDLGCEAIRLLLRGDGSPISNLARKQTDLFLYGWGFDTQAKSAFAVHFLTQLYWPWGKKPLFEETHTILCKTSTSS